MKLLEISMKYDIQALQKICEFHIEQEITIHNVFNLLFEADRLGNQALIDATIDFLYQRKEYFRR